LVTAAVVVALVGRLQKAAGAALAAMPALAVTAILRAETQGPAAPAVAVETAQAAAG
jgi:hypothetical protein